MSLPSCIDSDVKTLLNEFLLDKNLEKFFHTLRSNVYVRTGIFYCLDEIKVCNGNTLDNFISELMIQDILGD